MVLWGGGGGGGGCFSTLKIYEPKSYSVRASAHALLRPHVLAALSRARHPRRI